jgi:uncharacterized protein YkwD
MKSIKIISLVWVAALLNCSSAENIETELKNNTINKDLLLDLVNQLRVKGCRCGASYYPPVGKVEWSSVLEEVSLGHSKDMAKNSYFAHKAKDGSMTQQRLERADYNWQSYGENIYRTGGYSATEEEVVKAWRDSPGHCSNLMGRHFKEMGVAKHNDYWTQVFGSQMR